MQSLKVCLCQLTYNKQEKQNQNTAPTSPSIHPAQAALVPAAAHKQLRCEPPLAHPSRWPEQQKSPAQEACIRCMGCLKSFPGSAKGPLCPQTEERLPSRPFASSYTRRCLCSPVKGEAREAVAGNGEEYWLQSWLSSH